MAKPTKFTPGSFLEVSDMHGGRKVVLVCRDGITYWDACDEHSITPLMIVPEMHPEEIGTLSKYVFKHELQAQLRAQMAWLRSRADTRINDPLFFMRMLWCIKKRQEGKADEAALEAAYEAAMEQEQMALNIHRYIDKIRAVTKKAGN